jgi:3,2-trans-enoyl-CoA isomerase
MINLLRHGDICEISLARPPVNALNPALVLELNEAIQNSFDTSKALVISGREGLFSAGLDVIELMQLDREQMTVFWKNFFALLETVARSPIPVAAALTGHAPAGGAVLSIFCDYRVMTLGKFKIGLNETRVGLLVPGAIRQALIRLTGSHHAERMIVSGALISPENALSIGMVDDLADSPAACVTAAVDWCEGMLALPPHSMLGNRALMRDDLVHSFQTLDDDDISGFVDRWFSSDTQQVLKQVIAGLKK